MEVFGNGDSYDRLTLDCSFLSRGSSGIELNYYREVVYVLPALRFDQTLFDSHPDYNKNYVLEYSKFVYVNRHVSI